jgi:hypothetical protein
MATLQEQADAAYTQFRQAAEQFAAMQAGNAPGGALNAAAQRLANAEAASNAANDALRATYNAPVQQPETPQSSAGDAAMASYYAALEADLANRQRQERDTASSFLRTILSQYNLDSLADQVDSLVTQWGTNTEVIAERLRQTEPYKQRFKGLLNLQQRGITDIRDEAEYLNLESQYRQVFREAGIQNFLGDAGSRTEQDAIAKIVGDFSLSVNEVRDRVTDAQRVVAETPQEVRDSLQRFYNVDPATLTAYVLDPQRTSSEIQRLANAAIVGGYAQRAGLDFGAGVSERIGELLGGERDIMGTQIEPQLSQIAQVQKATGRLAQLEKGTLTAEETALAELDLDAAAKQKVRGLQSRERARFGGTSGITAGSLSRAPSV